MTLTDDQSLLQRLKEDPGDPIFAEYGDRLRRRGAWSDALDVLLTGLSINPGCHRGRLVLARLFYDRDYNPFALRELRELHTRLPGNKSLAKLVERFSGQKEEPPAAPTPSEAAPAEKVDTVAESEFDIGDLEMIDEDQK